MLHVLIRRIFIDIQKHNPYNLQIFEIMKTFFHVSPHSGMIVLGHKTELFYSHSLNDPLL